VGSTTDWRRTKPEHAVRHRPVTGVGTELRPQHDRLVGGSVGDRV
jgi:hypothetical protein